MSDLSYIQATQEVKIAGQDSTGNQVNYVGADANGNMTVINPSDGPVTPGTVATKAGLIAGQFNTVLPTLTTGQQSALQSDSSGRLLIAGSVVVNPQSTLATYGTSSVFIVAASATDVFTLTGSGTKTLKVRNIGVSGTNTGNTNVFVNLIKRSSADTGGTSTTPVIAPFDSADAAATGVVRAYTISPTVLGTTVATLRTDSAFFPTLASTNQGTSIEHDFGIAYDKPIYLRGTSEILAINLGGVLITGTTTIAIDITWTEE